MTRREDVMRAALARIASASRPECEWAKRALAEVDALSENDTAALARLNDQKWQTAETRLARIAELLALVCEDVALEDAHIALSIARGEEPS